MEETAPNFENLAKNAKDIFMSGYHQGKGLVKVNVKTTSGKNFEMISNTVLNFEASKLTGMMETRYKGDPGGILIKWTTDGALFLGCELNELFLKGFDLLSECNYNPETDEKNLKLSTKYITDNVNARCDIMNDLTNTSFVASVVVKAWDFLAGYRAGYDTATNKMTNNDLGMIYSYANFDFHLRCTDIPYEYGMSLMYKVNDNVDIAANGVYARTGNVQKWNIGAGGKCNFNDNSTFRFKVNTDLQLAMSLLQKLRDGIALTLSFNVDCANITKGGHQVGLALDLEA